MKRSAIMLLLLLGVVLILLICFQNLADRKIIATGAVASSNAAIIKTQPANVVSILMPAGYTRVAEDTNSFAYFLRNISLRKDNHVYLYNGELKYRQDLHYAVLDISTGNKDLQQCADAIMRLRAEYFFERKEYGSIWFPGSKGMEYNFQQYAKSRSSCFTHECLLKFLETVFTYCGTYTVDAMTKQIDIKDMQPGDVFVKAGAPGHAMIVMDMAVNETSGNKIYLLAQSFMPAQDMHIVINPSSSAISPWYLLNEEPIVTPGWEFSKEQLRRFR